MNIKEIVDLFKETNDYKPPGTYKEALNRQCKVLALPTLFVMIFSWLPYIDLDQNIFPQIPELLYFRVGLSAVSFISTILFFVPFFRSRSYHLLLFAVVYMELSTGMILGLVAANPVYMGGFSFLVLVVSIIPLQPRHALTALGVTLVLFVVVGFNSGMQFNSWEEKYGVYNLGAAVVISIFCVFFLDNIRRRNYESHRAVHRINEELQSTFVELRTINEELEQTSIELSTKNEELRNANEIKSELLGIASHDLKNPLQVIIGYAGLLQERMKEDKFAHDRLGMITKSSDKMLKLITELLETAATDRGRLKMNLTAVDVGKTADAVLKNIIYLAEKKNQEIFFSAENECTVRGDKLLLQQVMDNLIGNAIKFSPSDKRIWITVEMKSSFVTFTVRDEGPGLTADDKKKIFARFQRLSAVPTGGETSTGLGLSITRDMVKLHKGNIEVESEQGKGTVFSVQLPVLPSGDK